MIDEERDVGGALAQRRDGDLISRQAVIQILAELPLADQSLDVAMGRCDQAHVDAMALLRAERRDDAILQKTEELDLERRRDVADLVEKQRAAVGARKRPAAVLTRIGEGAARRSEQFILQKRVGNRAAVDGDERAGNAVAEVVDRLRDELLAAAALAENHYRHAERGHAGDGFVHCDHRRMRADDARGRTRLDLDFISDAIAERRANACDQFAEVERLGEVIKRADALRQRRRFDRAARGHQDHARRIAAFGDRLQKREAGLAGHVDIAEDEIDAMRAQRLERGGDVVRLHGFQAGFFERHGRAFADAGIVVDHEHGRHYIAPAFAAAAASGSVMRNREPPSFDSTLAAPPCHLAISETSESPSPSPFVPAAVFPRTKRAKIFSRSVSLIPAPRSSTSRIASLLRRATRTVTAPDVYLSALPIRLSTTRSRSAASARTKTSRSAETNKVRSVLARRKSTRDDTSSPRSTMLDDDAKSRSGRRSRSRRVPTMVSSLPASCCSSDATRFRSAALRSNPFMSCVRLRIDASGVFSSCASTRFDSASRLR